MATAPATSSGRADNMHESSGFTEPRILDAVGIGFGPANIALAIAVEELAANLAIRFLEANAGPGWQQGLLLDGADIQNNPLRDLVTLRNPRSRYSFVNYLHEQGRLIEALNIPAPFPLRKDYARYVAWAADQQAGRVAYDQRVARIQIIRDAGPAHFRVTTESGDSLAGRALILGTGRTPRIPEVFQPLLSDRVFHASSYLDRIAALERAPEHIAVIGGSQTAVELALDLDRRFPQAEIALIIRGVSLTLKDTSPFSERCFFPDFVDYFHQADRTSKDALRRHTNRTNYSCVDRDVLDQLYMRIYEQRLDGAPMIRLIANAEMISARPEGGRVFLRLRDAHDGAVTALDADLTILATGYRDLGPGPGDEPFPPILAEVIDHFRFDNDGYLVVGRDYRVEALDDQTPILFLNGLCETSHGIGDAGSFSLLALRARILLEGVLDALDVAGVPGIAGAG